MMKKRANRLFIFGMFVVVAGVLFACYFSMVGFYKTHYLPNTYVSGRNVGGWTFQDLEGYYLGMSDDRTLVLNGRDAAGNDVSGKIALQDVDFRVSVPDNMGEVIAGQSPWIWFTSYFSERRYDMDFDVSYDEDRLSAAIRGSVLMDGEVVEPEDARLSVSESGYEIVPEVPGNALDFDKAMDHVGSVLSNTGSLLESKEIVVDLQDDYKSPSVYSDDGALLAKLSEIESFGDFEITVDLVGATDVLAADSVVRCNDDGSIGFDEDRVADYVDGLARKYTTLHSTRDFRTSRGDVIQLQSDIDSYGFIFDKPKTVESIMDALDEGKSTTVDAVWWEGYGLPKQRDSGQGDIGDTYVEVSIDEQHMWYYQDGELKLDTDVTTGTDVDSRRTPTGVFFIWKRESPSKLTGSYGSSNVQFWMAFSWDGCGIHDASWRSNYGGDVYLTNGSHGCVNTPYDACKRLYDMISLDTPVVVYRR